MKGLLIITMLGLYSFSAFSDCRPLFKERITEIHSKIRSLQDEEGKQALYEAFGATTAFGVGAPIGVQLAASTGFGAGSAQASTTMGGVAVVLFTGVEFLIDSLTDDLDYSTLVQELSETQSSLGLIKDAYADNGPYIQKYMSHFYKELGNKVSPFEVSNSIKKLNSTDEFCMNNKLDGVSNIINKTIEEMKK